MLMRCSWGPFSLDVVRSFRTEFRRSPLLKGSALCESECCTHWENGKLGNVLRILVRPSVRPSARKRAKRSSGFKSRTVFSGGAEARSHFFWAIKNLFKCTLA